MTRGHGERPASLFFPVDSRQLTKLECSLGVKQGDAMGPGLFCVLLRPVLMGVREEYVSQTVESYAFPLTTSPSLPTR